MFALSGPSRSLTAVGPGRRLPAGPASSLQQRSDDFFQAHADTGGPSILVGAIPFDPAADDLLVQPRQLDWGATPAPYVPSSEISLPTGAAVTAEPSPGAYAAQVRHAVEEIASDSLDKVVLARTLRVRLPVPVDAGAVLSRLRRDPSVTVFNLDLSPASGRPGHRLVGATPELLVSRSGMEIASHPLAGSARRHDDQAADQEAAGSLLRSDKDRREHALVVEYILDTLSPHCARLRAGEPALTSTATMWHLGTRIEGLLKSADAPSAAGLAALLHPTPAVGGIPRDAAVRTILDIEGGRRGFYAGAIGWVDANGDGEWHVTLRCAEIDGNDLLLHAGAGVVAGSDPDAEVAETAAKFRAMLAALDLDKSVLNEEALSC